MIHQPDLKNKCASTFTGFPKNSSSAELNFNPDSDPIYKENKYKQMLSQDLLKAFAHNCWLFSIQNDTARGPFFLYSEYHRDGIIFRGHPNFRSLGPWHDWVTCQYERCPSSSQSKTNAKKSRIAFGLDEEDYDTKLYIPSQIYGFFESQDEETMGETIAIVKTLEENSIRKESVITSQWKMCVDPPTPFAFVSAEQFVRHSLIIPADETNNTYIEVLPSELWADEFLPDE